MQYSRLPCAVVEKCRVWATMRACQRCIQDVEGLRQVRDLSVEETEELYALYCLLDTATEQYWRLIGA